MVCLHLHFMILLKDLFLVRDRFGIKPLFYYFKTMIYFASEIEAIKSFKQRLKLNKVNF